MDPEQIVLGMTARPVVAHVRFVDIHVEQLAVRKGEIFLEKAGLVGN